MGLIETNIQPTRITWAGGLDSFAVSGVERQTGCHDRCDSIVRGPSRRIVKLLKEAGATEVHVAPQVQSGYPWVYGSIFKHVRNWLLPITETRDIIGKIAWMYLSGIDGLIDSIELIQMSKWRSLCGLLMEHPTPAKTTKKFERTYFSIKSSKRKGMKQMTNKNAYAQSA